MDKITFVNGEAPALNATNLNQLQTNIEEAIAKMLPVVLFQNDEGTISENITLSGSVTDFSYLEIFYGINGAVRYSLRSDKLVSQKVRLVHTGSSAIYFTDYIINDTSLTYVTAREIPHSTGVETESNVIYVYKIIGHR